MVTEYWLGWFDQWGGQHHVKDAKAVTDILEEILEFGASFNLYMFHGLFLLQSLNQKPIIH